MRDRVQHRHIGFAELECAIDRAVGVDRRITLVGRSLIVEIRLRVGPIPLRDDDVALLALRPRRRLGRQLTRCDAVGPISEHGQRRRPPDPVKATPHLATGLTRQDAPIPGRDRRLELAEGGGDLARGLIAELMAGQTPARLDGPDPLGPTLDVRRDAVAIGAGTRELALLGHLDHREPVPGRIVLRGRRRVGSHDGNQVLHGTGAHPQLLRVHQPVPAHPDVVRGLRQIGNHVAPLVVGHHGLAEPGPQIHRLRDHPNACLRSLWPHHDAADIIGVDLNGATAQPRIRPSTSQRDKG